MPGSIHQLYVDHSERPSALLGAVHRSGTFNVRMVRLATGDYLIDNEVRILQFLADEVGSQQQRVLRRFDRKPKRLTSRRLFLLQGLPGVGPALARRLLCHFGSVERVITVDAATLGEVRGKRGDQNEDKVLIWNRITG